MRLLVTTALCAVLTFGCGGGDDDSGDDDVASIDAAPPADAPDSVGEDGGPDAAVSQGSRAGTVAVSEIAAVQLGSTGASVSIAFDDLSGGVVAPVYDDRDASGAGCAVFVYDLATQSPPPAVDEGAVTISGTESPVPSCAFNADAKGYLCIAAAGTTGSGDTVVDDTALGLPENTAQVSISGVAFTAAHVGMFIRLTGFPNPANNGAFPIVALGGGANQIIIGNPAAVTQAMTGDGTFAVVAGAGPTGANIDFLAGGNSVTIAKPAGAETVAIDETVAIAGEGFTLATASAKPAAIATTGSAVTFTCSGAGGVCGDGIVTAVSGRTTDADVSALPAFVMPAATGKLATFSCAFFGETATVPTDAMTAILAADTTRIETRVFRFNVGLAGNEDGTNKINLLVGHGHIGWTSVD